MRNFCILILYLAALCLPSIKANIWDNLFYEEVIELHIPEEFLLRLSARVLLGKINVVIKGSIYLNKISVVEYAIIPNLPGLPVVDKDTPVIENILDIEKQMLTTHSLFRSCSKILSPPFNKASFEYLTGLLPLISLTLDHEKTGDLYKIKLSDILKMMNITQDIILFYDKNSELKKIEFEFAPGQKLNFDVVEFIELSLSESDFLIPSQWKCDEVEAVPYDQIKSEDILQNMLNGDLNSEYDILELLKNVPLDKLPADIRKKIEDELKKNKP
jgi:hypothetical protein